MLKIYVRRGIIVEKIMRLFLLNKVSGRKKNNFDTQKRILAKNYFER